MNNQIFSTIAIASVFAYDLIKNGKIYRGIGTNPDGPTILSEAEGEDLPDPAPDTIQPPKPKPGKQSKPSKLNLIVEFFLKPLTRQTLLDRHHVQPLYV